MTLIVRGNVGSLQPALDRIRGADDGLGEEGGAEAWRRGKTVTQHARAWHAPMLQRAAAASGFSRPAEDGASSLRCRR